MRLKMIVFTLLLSISVPSAQTINLKGTVKKENGDPIQNARVSLKNHPSIVSLTSTTGEFTLSGTKSSEITVDSLVVVSRGYKSVLEKMTSFEKTDIAIKQKPSNPWIPSGPLEHRKGMVKIKAKGYDFEMGQPCDTVRGLETGLPTTDLEQPVHTVNFSYDFWMDTVEVLQSEYDSLMKQFYGSKYIRPSWSASNGLGNNYAAYIIEWGNAVAFCNARSKAEGLPDTAYSYSELSTDPFGLITLKNVSVKLHANAYRLPTEAEWEYACKGGTFTDYYWGKDYRPYPKTSADSAEAGQYAIFTYNSSNLPKEQKVGDSYYGVNEVARKKPNKYGLYDILGNVSEWCSDWFGFYPWGTVTDPTGIIPTDMNTAYHPLRGGNWGGSIAYLRATERGFPYNDYYYLFEGFRCVSSGISTGIKKVNRSVTQNLPSIDVSSGLISFNNVTNSKIEIYSLSGKTICSVTSLGNKYSFPANKLCAGSYIVNIKSNIVFNKTITITQ